MNTKVECKGLLALSVFSGLLMLGACSSTSRQEASQDGVDGRFPASHGAIKYRSMSEKDANVSAWGLNPMGSTPRETTEFLVSPLNVKPVNAKKDESEAPVTLNFRDSTLFPKLTDFLGEITVKKDIYYGREKMISKGNYTWFGFLDMHGEKITKLVGQDMPGWQERMSSDPQSVIDDAAEKLSEAKVMVQPVVVGGNTVPFEDVYWTMINGMQALSGMEVTPRRRSIDEKPKFYSQYVRDSDGKIKAKVFKSTKQIQ